MAPHSNTLAWKIPWTEEPGRLQSMGLQRVRHDWATSLSLFTFHFHALEREMATHSSVLAWRISGSGEPGGLPSMGSHRVGHDWSNLAAAAASQYLSLCVSENIFISLSLLSVVLLDMEFLADSCFLQHLEYVILLLSGLQFFWWDLAIICIAVPQYMISFSLAAFKISS